MKGWKPWAALVAIVAIGLGVGRWIGNSATGTVDPELPPVTKLRAPKTERDSVIRTPKTSERPPSQPKFDREASELGALPGQRTITFRDAESMRRFLEAIAGKGIAVLGSIDALNTLRVGFLNADELAALLDGTEDTGFIFPVYVPGGGSIQDGAIGFGDQFLRWLGVEGETMGLGKGLKIAVLDTGIAANGQFTNKVISTNYVELPDNPADQNGHGTAVASLIASELGLAPDATLLSYRIADDGGSSDTFVLAQAIIAATDAGADLINISLGSMSRSAILENAVNYAAEAGVLIVASAGNDGFNRIAYPAGYDQVIGVGAVDAKGEHLLFSNSGDVSIVAPGLALTSAWPDDQTINFTGTSASSPVVTGAIAAVMTQFRVPAATAWQMLVDSANEAGPPGDDSSYGAGVLNVGRTFDSKTTGITDLALASNYVTTDAQGQTVLQVTVENRGTSRIINAPVSVTTPAGSTQLNVTTLSPGEIQTFNLPLTLGSEEIQIDSVVKVSGGGTDANPANNRRVDVVVPAEDP
ncbi:peptidase S8 subtilisin [Haloferula helveola]|uniref:Peptidase S8 subtilisin n=1 Tax=Haloferula helveola TaxID=490095 RepID=A0ABN6GY38_9BACT|nr:peptidase S8 subtilisin [Haloferula helveola]